MSTTNRHVIVIGGGLAGLAAAAELSTAGLQSGIKVTLIEANNHLGGKMNLLQEKGFSFDMGPTIITIPGIISGIIRRSGRKVGDMIKFVDLDPQWRCHFEDGTVINLRKDPDVFAKELDAQFPSTKPGDGYKKFIEYSRKLYRLSEKVFFYKDLGAATDLMFSPPKASGIGGDLMAMVGTMHSTVAKQITKHVPEPHLCQVMEHFLQYVGSSPWPPRSSASSPRLRSTTAAGTPWPPTASPAAPAAWPAPSRRSAASRASTTSPAAASPGSSSATTA